MKTVNIWMNTKANGEGSVLIPWKLGIVAAFIFRFMLSFWYVYSLLYILSEDLHLKLCFPSTEGQAVKTE